MEFLIWFCVLALGTLYLLGSSFVLYLFGRKLAAKTRHWIGPNLGTALVAAACLPLAYLATFVPEGPIVQLGVGISLFAIFAQPICIGYWAGRRVDRLESERRWNKNADDWLAEWEHHEYVE